MDWDDARYFLAIAREGQMLGAARRLAVSQAKLSRHLATLEAALGTRLLERTTRGCVPTADGRAFLETAERMESAALTGMARLSQAATGLAGTVRIGAPDGLGASFLAPRLARLHQIHPGLRIQLVPLPRTFSLSSREADLAITVERPTQGRLRTKRLSDYTLGLYAGADYLARQPPPATARDLHDHVLVGYVEDLIHTPALNYAEEFLPGWRSTIEVSTAIGQLQAIRAGAGIGALHDFMVAGDRALCAVLPDLSVTRSYWAVWHEDLRTDSRVRACVAFLDTEMQAARADLVRSPAA
ncbi:MAG: LysR family transcriptional regulator [Qingshengfaniella sp.]